MEAATLCKARVVALTEANAEAEAAQAAALAGVRVEARAVERRHLC